MACHSGIPQADIKFYGGRNGPKSHTNSVIQHVIPMIVFSIRAYPTFVALFEFPVRKVFTSLVASWGEQAGVYN